jgi:alanine racemase
MSALTLALIDLSALQRNLQVVRDAAPNSRVMAVIKADAYGHGMLECSRALGEADAFAVSRLEEAIELRENEITHRILLLSTLLDEAAIRLCAKLDIDIVIHQADMARLLASIKLDKKINAWLKLDTGMHRAGLSAEEFTGAHEMLNSHKNIGEILHMSHFASAEETTGSCTRQQIERFTRAAAPLNKAVSLANSAAIQAWPETHGDWVRPGIMLYGGQPVVGDKALVVEPVMTLVSRVIAIRDLKPGDGVGYNSTWQCQRHSRIATVAIGYADGYPRHAKSGTPVLVKGHRAQLVGRVSMDLISIDITGVPGVEPGDEVVLWGEGLPVDEVAAHCDTISYDLLTGVSGRVPRIYMPVSLNS